MVVRRALLVLVACVSAVPLISGVSPAGALEPAPIYCVSEVLADGVYFIEDSVVLPDGSMFVAGTTAEVSLSDNSKGFVAKFLPDGSLDFGFGNFGVVIVDIGAQLHNIYGIALDASGRIDLGGTQWNPNPTGFGVRLLPNGEPDATFGSDGIAQLDGPVNDIAVGSDGRVLFTAPDVVALDSHGALDPTFGNNGHAGIPAISRLAVQPSGRIVQGSGGASLQVVGLTADGDPDLSFGTLGTTTVTFTTDHGVGDIAVAPDGTLAIGGGNRINGGTFHAFLVRLLPSGLPDPAFADALDWYNANATVTGVVIAADHSMAASTSAIFEQSALIKMTADGLPDQSFADAGLFVTDLQPWSVRARSDGALLMSLNQLPGQASAVFGFDSTGGCVDPVDALPENAAAYQPVAPARILDTRVGLGRPGTSPVPADGMIDLQVTGTGGVPAAGVSAVVLNVTATDAGGAGFVTVWPTGQTRPVASSLNLEGAGQTIAALVTVPVSASGSVSLYMQSGGHLIADVMGYYSPSGPVRAGRLETIEPDRVLDTRDGVGTAGATARPGAGQALTVHVVGTGLPVPLSASAVVVNLTATDAAAPGFVTAWPEGTRPETSSLNVTRSGQTIANQVIVPLGADGSIQLFTQSGTHLIADVAGWFTGPDDVSSASGLFVATAPMRHLDTRAGTRPTAGQSVTVPVAGQHLVPASGAASIVGTLTVTGTAAPGFFTAYPGGGDVPLASNLNVEHADQTIANHITTQLVDGTFKVATQTGGDIIVDITGWYTA